MHTNRLHITECPRDAMQGLTEFIPTEQKIRYIRSLLQVGFDVLDFCSFVSPKSVPQMADSDLVAAAMEGAETSTELLAIVGNLNGAARAARFPYIRYVGYPHSVSPTFLRRNINTDVAGSLERIRSIQDLLKGDIETLAYISMAFGNPYGDAWSPELVAECVETLAKEGIRKISLADTVAVATPEKIRPLFELLVPAFPHIEFGAHLHTTPRNWKANVQAVFDGGGRKLEGALLGLGGCPMAEDELTGNLPTENLLGYCDEYGIDTRIDRARFGESMRLASEILTQNTHHAA